MLIYFKGDNVHNLRIRGSDLSRFHDNDTLAISSVLFPLLSFLLPSWLENLTEKVTSTEYIIL